MGLAGRGRVGVWACAGTKVRVREVQGFMVATWLGVRGAGRHGNMASGERCGAAWPHTPPCASPLAVSAGGPAGLGPVRSLSVSERERTCLIVRDEVCVVKLREHLVRARLVNASDGVGVATMGGSSAKPAADGAAADAPPAGARAPAPAQAAEGEQLTDSAFKYHVLLRAGHTGRIVGLATAVAKPLLVSCAADATLRVWDLRRLTCQLVSPLPEVPYDLALHPDGNQLALALEGRLSLHHLGLDALYARADALP